MSDYPKDYRKLPWPVQHNDTVRARRWYGWEIAEITDPLFHRGNTRAIRKAGTRNYVPDGTCSKHLLHNLPNYKLVATPPGEWMEFRDFKAADRYLAVLQRMGV